MTDKQIIIDGVNVSGCVHFAKRRERFLGILQERCKCEMYYNEDCLCEIRTDCYYKQLKRKEQECEKAKQNAQDTYDLWQALMESFNILQGGKIKLEQECEELTTKCCQLKKENEELKEYKEDLTQRLCDMNAHKTFEIVELKQTLVEIKEIIKFNKTNRLSGGGDISIEQILQKINECEME